MSRPDVSQAKDVTSSQESEPPNRPKKLTTLIGLNNLLNFRLPGKDKDIYEDVLEALREGRDYEDWAWWPYLIFPIPEELYKEPDANRNGEFIKINHKYLPHMIELLQDAKWGPRLGYAVKLLDKLGDSGITKIIEGVPGRKFQQRRKFYLGKFLLTYNSVLAMPGYEDNQETRELCLRLLKGSWADYDRLVKRLESDVWGYEKNLCNDEVIGPADFGKYEGWVSRGRQGGTSYFSQGMKRAADGLPLNPKSSETKFVISEDRLRERLGGKGNQTPSTLDEGMRVSGLDDVPETWQGVWVNSYPTQHQGQPKTTRDNRYVPSSSASTRRQPAPAPDDYDYHDYKYEEDYIPDRDQVRSSRQHYAYPTSTRDYRGQSSFSRPRRAQPAPASGGQVLPEHVRRRADEYRHSHGYPEGEYHISKHHR